MIFIYDGGEPVALLYGGYTYYYEKNAMGDVVAILDEDGDTVVSYRYDAWGNNVKWIFGTCSCDEDRYVCCQNPIRYRGYYYDDDGFGAYYLQSRYYECEFNRFLNADIPDIARQGKAEINGLNLFAYCCNDPVNNYDPTGYYNANKAYLYAHRWWSGTNSRYGRNGTHDCANFVSQCLYAGGLSKMTGISKWGWHNYRISKTDQLGRLIPAGYDRSHAWAGAENLYQWLVDNKFISKSPNYVINGVADADKVAKKMYGKSRGSALLFFDWYGQKPGNTRHFGHVAILGQVLKWYNKYYIYYYAHTTDRFGECYMPDGSFSPAYLQYIYKDSNYRYTRIYIYCL